MFRRSARFHCAAAAAAAAAASTASRPSAELSTEHPPGPSVPAGPSLAAIATLSPEDFALARKVKHHCSIALNKYKSGHAQLFLQRGRAYLELGQPYFALGDFREAGENLNVGAEFEMLVADALREIGHDEQVMFFESADNHLGLLVNPNLGRGVEMRTIPNKGRGVFASQGLMAGEAAVKRCQAWLSYPLSEGFCSACGGAFGVRRFPCKNPDCHEEYCSRECRVGATQTYHSGVCANKNFQNMELELYAKLKSAQGRNEYNTVAVFLLLMRVLSAAITNRIVPSSLPQMRTLSGRLVYNPVTLSTTTLDLYRRLVRATTTQTSVSYEEFICCLAKLTGNIFQDDSTIYCHVTRSMLNHSCDPNVVDTGGELVATRTIAPNEEVCASYYPALNDKPYDTRTQELKARGFSCLCNKCTLRK
jgi:hypothetical protein